MIGHMGSRHTTRKLPAMLKNVNRLLERHPVYDEDGGFGGVTMEQLYADVSKYELPSGVPDGVQRSFDAARHTYIYSYFSYDLLTPAIGQLFACLELALRKRLGHSWDGKSRMPGLFDMLNDATRQKLILSNVSVLHKLRNVFQHGTEAIIDPNMFLNMLEKVTSLVRELYDPTGDP
jgi:hypothetical protein